MSSHFSVCTYNLGAGVEDYVYACKYFDPNACRFKNKPEEDAFRTNTYIEIQKNTAQALIKQADVYCLQEVMVIDRPMIEALQKEKFEIVYLNGIPKFDTAIALNTQRFKDISNHSIDVKIPGQRSEFFKKDAAIAVATDIQTGERIAFVSAHVPGMDLTLKKIDVKEASEGDFYSQAIANKLAEFGDCMIHVVGADMNANPEKWNERFQIFSKKGFQILRTNAHTNVNWIEKDAYPEREIDFIFVKTPSSIWQKLAAIFVKTVQRVATINLIKPLEWDMKMNASDHVPVFATITTSATDSLIYRFWLSIRSMFVSAPQKPATT